MRFLYFFLLSTLVAFPVMADPYALVDDQDQIVKTADSARVDLTAGVETGYSWRPIVNAVVDNSTPGNNYIHHSDPVVAVTPTEVTRTVTISDMTAQEIDDIKGARADRVTNTEIGKLLEVVFETMYDLDARVRVLEGQPARNLGQFKTYAVGLDNFTTQQFRDWAKDYVE